MSYTSLQQAVDDLRASNDSLSTTVINADSNAASIRTDAEAARDAAQTAETGAKGARDTASQHKLDAEAARDSAQTHKTAAEEAQAQAEAQPALAETEADRAETARDATALVALGPDNDKLSSIAKVYGSPSLMLDFVRQDFWKQGKYPWVQDALDPAVDLTFTRASTATYFDKDGVLQTAAVDEARFDHDPATGEALGVLIEESRTNQVPYSEDFTQWVTVRSVIQADATTAPDGTLTASRLGTVADGTTSECRLVYDLNTVAFNLVSVYLKKDNWRYVGLGTGNFRYRRVVVDLDQGSIYNIHGAGGYYPTITSLGGGWFRVDFQSDSSHNYYDDIHIGIYDPANTDMHVAGETEKGVFIWGAQCEVGAAFPTSYIPTTAGAAVTRSGEDLRRSPGGEVAADQGTFVIEVVLTEANTTTRLVGGLDHTAGYINVAGGALKISSYDGNGLTLDSPLITLNTPFKAAVTFGNGKKRLALDGVSSAENSLGADYPLLPVTSIKMSDPNSSSNEQAGRHHIKRLEYYPRAMTAAELEALTT